MATLRHLVVASIALVCVGTDCLAATLSEARSGAIAWLERNQNDDGSWGAGSKRPVVTAEALLALARAGREDASAARRAIGWLRNHDYTSLDYRARALRALAAAGESVSEEAAALDALGAAADGWGPTSAESATSYDSALVLGAIRAGGVAPQGETAKLDAVFARRRSDGGWGGDGVPVAPGEASDRTLTAEIVRALGEVTTDTSGGSPLFASFKYVSTDTGNGGAAVDGSTPLVELAARLAAVHRVEELDAALESELLGRFASGAFDPADPFVNALGLLAVTTRPGASFPVSCANPNDTDCDGTEDAEDAFPHDPGEQTDTDGDGEGDLADDDDDGDGVADAEDAFELDPTEWADSDGDGIGDNAEVDSDDDGIDDVTEVELGSDPTVADSDGDGALDGADPCPLIANGADDDGDGVCTPFDECETFADAFDTHDLDGDGTCDGADDDDDGDSYLDDLELAAGSDPRDDTSTPPDLVTTDPTGDFDGDGLANDFEAAANPYVTSPFLADTDADGAPDRSEILASPATDPTDPASQPPAVLAVIGGVGAAEPAQPTDPFPAELTGPGLRATATGAQATPVALPGEPQEVSLGADAVSLAGFQPQTGLGRDLDGDGLAGAAENAQRTSQTSADTDGDRFADGAGGIVPVGLVPDARDLDGDGFTDGEAEPGTDPSDAEDHPGKPMDVAPLGHPDGRIDVADALVGIRLATDVGIAEALDPQNEEIAKEAADVDGDGTIAVDDALRILNAVKP